MSREDERRVRMSLDELEKNGYDLSDESGRDREMNLYQVRNRVSMSRPSCVVVGMRSGRDEYI